MLFEVVYPALVRAKAPRRPSTSLCVVRREAEIEIPEISTSDVPHVLTVSGEYVREVQDWGGAVPVRKIGDRYYRPVLTVEQFAETLKHPLEPIGPHSDRLLARRDVFEPVRARLEKGTFGCRGPGVSFWPPEIEYFLHAAAMRNTNTNIFSSASVRFETSGGKIALDDTAQTEADRCLEFFVDTLSEHVVIDGHVWRETLEPAYVVQINGLMQAAFPESLAALPGLPPDVRSFGSRDYFFAADCRDEAIEFAREHCNDFDNLERMLSSTGDMIEIVDPAWTSGLDTVRLGLLAAARDMQETFGRDPMTNEGLRVFRELGEAVATSDGRTGISPSLEEALTAAVSHVEADSNRVNRRLGQSLVDDVRLHLHRLDDLSCTVPIARGPSI